jgi:hypothetical protein
MTKYVIHIRNRYTGEGYRLFRGKDCLPVEIEADSPADACKTAFDSVGPVFIGPWQRGTKEHPAATPVTDLYAEEIPMSQFKLIDGEQEIDVTVEVVSGKYLEIRPAGYGEKTAEDGFGAPLFLELVDGELRVVLFPDINSEEAQIVSLEGAKESNRHSETPA